MLALAVAALICWVGRLLLLSAMYRELANACSVEFQAERRFVGDGD